MNLRIAVIPGDGIGVEVTREALRVLDVVCPDAGIQLQTRSLLAGGCATDAVGVPLPEGTLAEALASDAVLLGAVGGPKWDVMPYDKRPERALLGLRKALQVFANIRPVRLFAPLASASTLRADVALGTDLVVVRELVGGIYFGTPRGIEGDRGVNTMVYTVPEIERVARVAFAMAEARPRKLLHSIDKANVLETTELWRRVVTRIGKDEFPGVRLEHMLVDNCAMQLVRNPRQFDVVLTENLFGDILSDEAAMLTGSLGMLPSASLGAGTAGKQRGLFEPVHGSAPDIAGKDLANPLAAILSTAMLLRYSAAAPAAAERIENAVEKVLAAGMRTGDIALPGEKSIGTRAMGDAVLAAL